MISYLFIKWFLYVFKCSGDYKLFVQTFVQTIEYIITIYNTMYMNLEVENVKNELILHNKFKNQ